MSGDRRIARARSLTTEQLIDVFAPPLPQPGPTAFRRLMAARPHLTPSGPGDYAFRLWLASIGESPPEDDIPALYADMAALCGWPMAESPAIEIASLAPPTQPKPEPVETYPPLFGRDAARQFVAHLRETGQCGSYTPEELAARYSTHARAINRQETPVNMLRKELAKLPGVIRSIKDDKGTRVGGKQRSRTTTWTILRATAAAPEPNPSLAREPMRVAA